MSKWFENLSRKGGMIMKMVSQNEGYYNLVNAVYETAARDYVAEKAKGYEGIAEKNFIKSGAYLVTPGLGDSIIEKLDRGLERTQNAVNEFVASNNRKLVLRKSEHLKNVAFAVGKANHLRTIWPIDGKYFYYYKKKGE